MKRKSIIIGFFIALVLSLLVSFFASELPDGLEKVMEKLGISSRQQEASTSPYSSPIPEYRFPGVKSPIVSTALAALTGMAVVFGVVIATGTILRKYRSKQKYKTNKKWTRKVQNRQ